MSSPLLVPALAAATIGLFVVATAVQRRLRLAHEVSRKLVHMTSGVVAAVTPLVFERSVLLAAAALLLLLLPIGGYAGWFPAVVRPGRSPLGPLAFLTAYLALLALDADRHVLAAAFLTVAFADAAACLVGQKWGRRRFADSARTWVGTAAFVMVALVVNAALSGVIGVPLEVGVAVALSIALCAGAAEVVVPSALDNLVIPLVTAFLWTAAASWSETRAVAHLAELAAAVFTAGLALRLGWLRERAALAVLVVGILAFVGGDWRWVMVLLAFFVPASWLTHLAPRRSVQDDASGGRSVAQVLALGLTPAAMASAHALVGGDLFAIGFVAAVAAAAADTFATEIGRLSRAAPRLITTLRPVARGTSGGVTMTGLSGAAAGAVLVAGSALALGLVPIRGAALAAAAGYAGCILDSLLGATAQVRLSCGRCGWTGELESHSCGGALRRAAGAPFMTNEVVNLVMTALATAIAMAAEMSAG